MIGTASDYGTVLQYCLLLRISVVDVSTQWKCQNKVWLLFVTVTNVQRAEKA